MNGEITKNYIAIVHAIDHRTGNHVLTFSDAEKYCQIRFSCKEIKNILNIPNLLISKAKSLKAMFKFTGFLKPEGE